MYPLQCANNRHGITHFTVDAIVRDKKHSIPQEQSITFPLNKIIQLFVRDYVV